MCRKKTVKKNKNKIIGNTPYFKNKNLTPPPKKKKIFYTDNIHASVTNCMSVGHDMSHPVVIQFRGNPGCNKRVTFNFTFLVLLLIIVNVPFGHEDGGGMLCKLDILVIISFLTIE